MDLQVHRTRDSPMVCPGRRFSRSAFFPEWPPIEMIEMIEMIEIIEMILDRLGRDTLREGPWWGGRVGDIFDLGGFDSGDGCGICLWFERFRKMFKPCFPDPPRFC